MDELNMCAEFHKVMAHKPITGWRDIEKIPEEPGLYCAYEDGEACTGHTLDNKRIVYVGINDKERGTLHQRISRHYSGNLSILWTHVCWALYGRGDIKELISFPDPSDIKEIRKTLRSRNKKNLPVPLVDAVSDHIKNHFAFRCLPIENLKERKDFEKKIIATISACPVCEPSSTWLGKYSKDERLSSKLWNVQHTNGPGRLYPEDFRRLRDL